MAKNREKVKIGRKMILNIIYKDWLKQIQMNLALNHILPKKLWIFVRILNITLFLLETYIITFYQILQHFLCNFFLHFVFDFLKLIKNRSEVSWFISNFSFYFSYFIPTRPYTLIDDYYNKKEWLKKCGDFRIIARTAKSLYVRLNNLI